MLERTTTSRTTFYQYQVDSPEHCLSQPSAASINEVIKFNFLQFDNNLNFTDFMIAVTAVTHHYITAVICLGSKRVSVTETMMNVVDDSGFSVRQQKGH